MSIQSQINRLKDNVSAAFDAVGNKGGTVPDAKITENLAEAIASIPEGVELNFEVVGGTAAPADPKENTIWLNTQTGITKWVVATDNPYMSKVELLTGDVTIEEGYYMTQFNGVVAYETDSNWVHTGSVAIPDHAVSVTIPTRHVSTSSVVHWFSDGTAYNNYVLRNHEDFTYTVPDGAKYLMASMRVTDQKTIIANVNNAVPGDVWITADRPANDAGFNTLEVNGVQVYPLSAKQYIDGSWKNVSAQIWQNGKWNKCVTYIYNNGKTQYGLTPKAIKNTSTSSTVATAPSVGVYASNFWALVKKGTNTNGSSGMVYFYPKVDLTNATTLYVDGRYVSDNLASNPYFAVWSEIGAYQNENRGASKALCTAAGQTKEGVISLDVSGLSGAYYIGFNLSAGTNTCSITVWDIYYD